MNKSRYILLEWIILGIVVILFLFYWNIKNRVWIKPYSQNPTVYVFDFPEREVRKAVYEIDKYAIFKNSGPGKPELTVDSFSELAELTKKMRKSFLKTDIVASFRGSYIDSHVYSDWLRKPCLISPMLKIHIDSLAPNSTAVSVTLVHGELCNGIEFKFIPWGSFLGFSLLRPKYVPLASSTIEEYEILHAIGKVLGEKNMPDVLYPE